MLVALENVQRLVMKSVVNGARDRAVLMIVMLRVKLDLVNCVVRISALDIVLILNLMAEIMADVMAVLAEIIVMMIIVLNRVMMVFV